MGRIYLSGVKSEGSPKLLFTATLREEPEVELAVS
jgi:hypothetical protein